jgi:hypothetical protein
MIRDAIWGLLVIFPCFCHKKNGVGANLLVFVMFDIEKIQDHEPEKYLVWKHKHYLFTFETL